MDQAPCSAKYLLAVRRKAELVAALDKFGPTVTGLHMFRDAVGQAELKACDFAQVDYLD